MVFIIHPFFIGFPYTTIFGFIMQSANIDFIMHWVQKVSFDSHKLLLVNRLNYVMVVTA